MSDPQRAEAESFKAAVCEEVADFYTRRGRDAIGRAAGRYLQAARITPSELLHSSRHQRALSDAGQNLMQAVQKTAIAQVKGTQIPVSERVRRLYELTDQLHKETLEKLEKTQPAKLEADTLPDQLVLLDGETPDEQSFRIRAALAETLDGINDWTKKFEKLYELGHDVAGLEAFGHFDVFIAEILRAPNACKDIFGELPSAGAEVERMHGLYLGDIEPFEAPDKPANAKNFYKLAQNGYLPETREVLLRLMTRALESSGKLTTAHLDGELAEVRKIYKAFDTPNGFLGGDDCRAALHQREAALLSDETIDLVVGGRAPLTDKLLKAMKLRKDAISEKGSDYLSRYVTSVMGQPDFERAVKTMETGLEGKLKSLAEIHQAAVENEFPPRIEDRICGIAADLQTDLLEETKYFKKLESRNASTADKALMVINLISNGTLVGKDNVMAARKFAHTFMKKPDFLESYLADKPADAKKTSLRDLERKLKESGLA